MPGSGSGPLRHARRDEVKIPFSWPKSRFRLSGALTVWSEMRTRIGLLIFGTAFMHRCWLFSTECYIVMNMNRVIIDPVILLVYNSESNSDNLVSTFLAETLHMGGSHGHLPDMCMTSLPDLFDVPSDLCELAVRRAQAQSTLGPRQEVK